MTNAKLVRILKSSAGLSALLSSFMVSPAAAQQSSPGGPNCPIVDGVATCSGNLGGGVTYSNGQPSVEEIRILNVNGEIAPPGYFGIGYTRTDRDLRLVIADGVVIRTFDSPIYAGPAQPIIMIGGNGRSVALDSGATIFANGNSNAVNGADLNTSGGAANITLINRGAVSVTTTAQDSVALSAVLQNATGVVTVRNGGSLTAVSGGSGERNGVTAGIRVTSNTGREVIVENTGNITITTGPNTLDTDFLGEATGIITNTYAPVSQTTITNSGTLTGNGPNAGGIVGFTRNDDRANASSVTINNTGAVITNGVAVNGILNQLQGLNGVAVTTNSGAITMNNANDANGLVSVIETAIGNVSITNSGTISASGNGYARAIGISGGNPNEIATYTYLIDNRAAIALASPFAQAITTNATRGDIVTATIRNTGNIDLSTTTDVRSQGIRAILGAGPTSFPAGRSSIEITNSGSIRMGAGSAIVVAATDSRITNSGTLTTTANGSHVVVVNGDPAPQTGIGPAAFTGTTLNFATSGDITASGSDSDAIRVINVDQVTIGVAAGATVRSGTGVGSTAISVTGNPSLTTINVDGTVRSDNNTGIFVDGSGTFKLNIGAAGIVEVGAAGVQAPTAAIVSLAKTDVAIAGAGQITGDVRLSDFDDTFVALGGANITGNLSMGAGNDIVRLANLDLNGAVDMGNGDDLVQISGLFGFDRMEGGAGNDTAQYTTAAGQALSLDLGTVVLGGFETFVQDGAGQITFTGANSFSTRYELRGGTLVLNAAVPNVDIFSSAGSTLSLGGTLRNLNVAGNLLIDGGRKASVASAVLAPTSGSSATATVTGAGTEWNVTGDLSVGANGTGAMTISDGAVVRSGRGAVGNVPSLSEVNSVFDETTGVGRVTVTGTNSRWDVARRLTVGVYADGDLIIANGASVTSAGSDVGRGALATGAFASNPRALTGNVTVSGTGSAWTDTGGVIIGNAGGRGTVSLAGGGRFTAPGLVVGTGATGTIRSRGTVNVTGAGSLVDIAGTATIGGFGGNGLLTLTDGGRFKAPLVKLADPVVVNLRDTSVTGTIAIGGGLDSNGAALAALAPGILDTPTLAFDLDGRASATLVFNHTANAAANYDFTAAMTGFGTVRHLAGVTRLSGNSSGFLGTTDVVGGSLLVAGTLGGIVNVGTGGLLGGSGTVGTLNVAGTLAPGFSSGTLSVNGNVTFQQGSTFLLELLAAGGGDRLTATGTATINGGTVAIGLLDPETSYVGGRVYRFLDAAGGLTGRFTGLTETSAFLDFLLSYDATGASVTIAQVQTFPDVAETPNETGVSGALAAFDQRSGSDSLAVYNSILQLDETNARSAFNSASGEIYPTMIASALRHGTELSGGLLVRANAESGEGWGLWGGASGHDGSIDGDGNGAGFTHDSIGGLLGMDYRGPDNGWALGVSTGYSNSGVSLRARASRAEGEAWHVGGYARYGTGGAGFTLAASAAYVDSELDVRRSLMVGTLRREAVSNVDIRSVTVSAEARYGIAMSGGWSLGPVARISYSDADLGGFAESGADSLNLSGPGSGDNRKRGGAGAFARWEGGAGVLDVSVAYVAAEGESSVTTLGIVGAQAQPFGVRSARGDGGAVAAALSGDIALGGGWTLGADARGAFGANERVISGRAVIGFRF